MVGHSEAPGVELVDKYRLIAEIGRGGMADVYLAVTKTAMGGFQKLVVIKLLRASLASEEDFLQMFLEEARIAARLSHPNVVQTNEVGADHGRYFIAMEYLDGQTLHRVMRHRERVGHFTIPMHLQVLTRVLAGMHYAHELVNYDGTPLHVVHRDVTPSNIFITYDGQVKLVDFGIAKALDSSSETRVGLFKGKAAYMAPEQIAGGSPLDRRSDIYAAGVVLWEMLTGSRMWKGMGQAEVMQRVSRGEIPSPRSVAPLVPPELEAICMRALERSPEKRYPTAAAMEAEIEAYLAHDGPRRPSDREIGSALSELFRNERADIRARIEAQLKAPAGPSSVLPDLGIPPAAHSATGGSLGSGGSAGSAPQPSESPLGVSVLQRTVLPRSPATWLAAAVGATLLAIGATALVMRDRTPRDDGARHPGTSTSESARGIPGEPAPPVRGVTDSEVVVGMSGAFSGPSRELGNRMKLGLDTAFAAINEQGGVAGRKLTLVALDDGYDAKRAGDNMVELLEHRGVFAVVGSVGTPTAQVAAPYAIAKKTLFFGAFTGLNILRSEPPDRYVINYRASYAEETAKMVHYLVDAKKVAPESIVVFAQHDSFGDAGFQGVARTLRKYGRADPDILRVNYERNTVDVDQAVSQIADYNGAGVWAPGPKGNEFVRLRHPVKAVIMVASYKAAARFIQRVKDKKIDATFLNVSFVGSNALADELKELGPGYGKGVIVTQVVPHYDSGGSGVIRYRDALSKYHPDQHPDFVSLEGYVVGGLLAEGLRRVGTKLDTESLIDVFESIRDFDMGIGTIVSYGLSEHQGSHKVWGTILDENGTFKVLDMD